VLFTIRIHAEHRREWSHETPNYRSFLFPLSRTATGECSPTCKMTPFEPSDEPAKRPFSSYKLCCHDGCIRCAVGHQLKYPDVGDVMITCDGVDGSGLAGRVQSPSTITLDDTTSMHKVAAQSGDDGANVTKVHMIYMNHCVFKQ
jgi:hypothetical protein